ncbi:CxxH/CxxC protein [Clostridium frigidicarnis]|uniref:CxxH/CxxC protein n=1 Tax=Clostridium frigidicarnis TaxID=84698 RepID=UPI001FA92D59|nr:CxxH/CxxC protein [Clostridium frigidicarnis]
MSSLKENKLCCEDHVDMVIDDFLVEEETFPVMNKIESGTCFYCAKKAKYMISSVEG